MIQAAIWGSGASDTMTGSASELSRQILSGLSIVAADLGYASVACALNMSFSEVWHWLVSRCAYSNSYYMGRQSV